jgi:uncharacterized protein (TIGR04255 family)
VRVHASVQPIKRHTPLSAAFQEIEKSPCELDACTSIGPLPLPNSIQPCPIVDALVEVRFIPNLPDEAVFGVLYESLAGDFPRVEKLPALQLPPQLRNVNRELRFQATYRLRSDNYYISIGAKVFAVGIQLPYPGWTAFRAKLISVFQTLIGKDVVKHLQRLGLRYINVFEGDVSNRLTLETKLGEVPLEGSETFFRTVLQRGNNKALLQVLKDRTLKRPPDFKRQGTSIDIDVSCDTSAKLELPILTAFIDDAHLTAKTLFFELLRPEFLKELNPTY